MINNNVTVDSPDRCAHKNVLKVVSGSEFLRSIVMRDITTHHYAFFFSWVLWFKWISPIIVLFMSDYCVVLLCFSASFCLHNIIKCQNYSFFVCYNCGKITFFIVYMAINQLWWTNSPEKGTSKFSEVFVNVFPSKRIFLFRAFCLKVVLLYSINENKIQ